MKWYEISIYFSEANVYFKRGIFPQDDRMNMTKSWQLTTTNIIYWTWPKKVYNAVWYPLILWIDWLQVLKNSIEYACLNMAFGNCKNQTQISINCKGSVGFKFYYKRFLSNRYFLDVFIMYSEFIIQCN